jgi:endo-1,4-beta-xylanase
MINYRTIIEAMMALLLVACSKQVQTPAVTNIHTVSTIPTETPIPSDTPIPTITVTSTPTETPTATPIPTLEGFPGIPDPRISNPELFDLGKPDAPIPQFVNAMKMAGIEVTGEQVDAEITSHELKDKDGNSFVVAVYNLDPDPTQTGETLEGSIPLIIAGKNENGEWQWEKTYLKNLGKIVGIKMGIIIEGYGYDNNIIQNTLYNEFNFALVDYDNQWKFNEPEKDIFNYGDQHKVWVNPHGAVNFANTHDMEIMFNNIIFVESYPDWLINGSFSKEELKQIVQTYIKKTIAEFINDVKIWTVINEFHSGTYPWVLSDKLANVFGYDLIDFAFQTAREADPSAILIYNDGQNHTQRGMPNGTFYVSTYKIVQRLKSQNLIDGVGLHMHIDGNNPPTKNDVINTMKSYGVAVYITEFDVNLKDVFGTNEKRYSVQAKIFGDMMEACIESDVCKVFNQFSVGDKYSWIENATSYDKYSKNGDPTAFDDKLDPKPAYYALLQSMMESITNPVH